MRHRFEHRPEHHAGAIPDQDLDPVCSFCTEDEGRATEGIVAYHLLHGQGQPVDALAEVDRTGRDVDPELPVRKDHAEAARTARITRVSWVVCYYVLEYVLCC